MATRIDNIKAEKLKENRGAFDSSVGAVRDIMI